MVDEKQNEPSKLGNAIKSTIAIGTIAGMGFAAGYFVKDFSRPTSNISLQQESGIEYLIHDEQRYPVNVHDGRISIGDTDYLVNTAKSAMLEDEHKETYARDMITFGLDNTEHLSYDTLTAIVDKTEGELTNDPSMANRLMSRILDEQESSNYTPETKSRLETEFHEMGEDNPTIYNGMGDRFKAYARHEIVSSFVDQLKQDGKKIAKDVQDSETYRSITETAQDAFDTTKKFINENIVEGYHNLKEKVLGK